ncbi:hypothetical protein T02_13538 [Trichinella nativa]|uniref:Uncharacterized protein n=1 Tax=Trichinella nativa TaxID=6335 RepID=A0A0V1LL21_9BILA|nr:hypothetical protein T02_13538 [Trichinella nativa]
MKIQHNLMKHSQVYNTIDEERCIKNYANGGAMKVSVVQNESSLKPILGDQDLTEFVQFPFQVIVHHS